MEKGPDSFGVRASRLELVACLVSNASWLQPKKAGSNEEWPGLRVADTGYEPSYKLATKMRLRWLKYKRLIVG